MGSLKLLMILAFFLALTIIIAVFPMPYEYYMGLRVFVFSASGFLLFDNYKTNGLNNKVYWLGVVIILYNPIIKVSLNKEIWMLINIIACVLFLSIYKELKDRGEKKNDI